MEEYKKVTISFTKEQLEKLDEIMSKEQGYTRSSLVREAVDYYLGYLAQKGSVSYLSPIISQNIKLVLGRFEENLGEMLFKLAVEVSKSNILSARNSDLNDYALNYLNDVSEQLVAEHNGILDLEKARDFINSSKQDDLILSVVKHFPQSKKFLEYKDYYAMPTRENANEFLNAVAERYADRADELKVLVNYISNRRGVEKLGSHGLFSQFDMPIDLDTVAERVANHDGVIWTEVVSLRREDAERLHFNNAEAWKNLIRRNMNEIAKAHRIKIEDLEWFGAFHNTTHHPHIHLVIFSKGQEGFLSEKGIKELRRAFGQDIFRDEQYKLATIETGYRNELKDDLAELLQQIQARKSLPNADYYLFLLRKIKDELQQQKGKKLYGYLPRELKRLVDFALHEFAKESDLA